MNLLLCLGGMACFWFLLDYMLIAYHCSFSVHLAHPQRELVNRIRNRQPTFFGCVIVNGKWKSIIKTGIKDEIKKDLQRIRYSDVVAWRVIKMLWTVKVVNNECLKKTNEIEQYTQL